MMHTEIVTTDTTTHQRYKHQAEDTQIHALASTVLLLPAELLRAALLL